MNERKTESIIRQHFSKFLDTIYIEEQRSDNPKIDKLLKTASKKGDGKGYPEFIISYKTNPDLLIVVECKADVTKHESKDCDKYSEFAVDGALLYASYLSNGFDVLAIAVSGEIKQSLKVFHFLHLRGEKKATPIFGDKLLSIDDYLNGYLKSPEKFRQDYNSLLDFAKQLIGTEYQSHIFALAVSNMYIHQDGKTNIINGSCFDEEVIAKVKAKKPTVCFLNPPYKSDKNELEFVLNNLECLVDGGTCVAIVPMERVLSNKGITYELKKKLLEKHSLRAVLSMPNELFNDSKANAVTSVLIFTAHKKHDNDVETYFGYYKDDGFVIKRKGRVNVLGDWKTRLDKWTNYYKRGKEEAGFSVKKCINADSEWCAEAYLETDYNKLTVNDFKKKIQEYLSYLLTNPFNQNELVIDPLPKFKDCKDLQLQTNKWKYFNYKDIFLLKKGKRLTKEDQENGIIPYVSSSALNNGVDNYIDNGYTDENCLSFACYGSIGEIFYQKEQSWISDNCNAIYIKNKSFNTEIALFISTVMELEKIRFSYGMTAKKERLLTFKIKLPSKDNQLDWEFMEKYIKSLPYSSSI